MVMTPLMERLGLTIPIIQAPMAASDTVDLMVAVANAGGMGSMGATYLPLDQMQDRIEQVRRRTNRGFNVNLFAPQEVPDLPEDPSEALERLSALYEEVDGAEMPEVKPEVDPFDARFPLALESGAKVFSFTFGMLPDDAMRDLKDQGIFIIGTATTVEEAKRLEDSGVDAVTAQGAEAGGHRGTFVGSFEMSMIGTMALVPQVVDAVSVPVIASGGIADGRGIAAALMLGAQAVQIGTVFLPTEEAGPPEAHKQAILDSQAHESRLTRAFSGRPARGLANRMMDIVEPPGEAATVLPFPYQNSMTRPLRGAAAKAGQTAYLSLWAGQAAPLARREKAADTVARLVAEMEAALAQASRL